MAIQWGVDTILRTAYFSVKNSQWYNCDDTSVILVDQNLVERAIAEAYILLYNMDVTSKWPDQMTRWRKDDQILWQDQT